jgi:hypothetical protein
MTLARKNWQHDFGQTLVSGHGCKLPVEIGVAWIVGRCTVHLDAEGDHKSVISIRTSTSSRNGEGDSGFEFGDFSYDFYVDDPYIAATMVLRWLNGREAQVGDSTESLVDGLGTH